MWMELSAVGNGTTELGRGSTTGSVGTGHVLKLHTARKRSKASLLNIGTNEEAAPALSDPGGIGNFSNATLPPANTSIPRQGSGFSSYTSSGMLAGSGDARGRAPLVLSGSNGNNGGSNGRLNRVTWQLGGWSVDYALDWAAVLIAIILLGATEKATPRAGYVTKSALVDTSYPLFPNSVPAWSVPMYTLVLPAGLFALHCVALRRSPMEAHHLILGLMTAVLTTAAITNLIKCPVGRLRPDFNARCWPDGKIVWQQEDELGGYPLCSGPADSVAEGRKSFPSGHSSWSASGLCYLTWWLLDRLHPFDGSGHPWRLAAAVMPALAAVAVGISRYTDYWHHASDVAAGLALGAFISWLCYRQQRGRLADMDSVTYGSSCSPGSAWGALGSRASGEDGTPLLVQQQPQQQIGLLPV